MYKHVQKSIYYKITNEYIQVLRVLLIPNSKSETVKTCSDFSSNFVNAIPRDSSHVLSREHTDQPSSRDTSTRKISRIRLGEGGLSQSLLSPLKNDPQVFVINFLERLPLKLSRLENIVSSLKLVLHSSSEMFLRNMQFPNISKTIKQHRTPPLFAECFDKVLVGLILSR